MNEEDDFTSRALRLLETRYKSIGDEIEAANRSRLFGRVTPEAAMKNLEVSLQHRKDVEESRLQQERWRAERLKVPVTLYLGDFGELEIPRPMFEEIEHRMQCRISYDDECERMAVDVLTIMLREGLIRLAGKDG